jgi:hypothetical protein
VPRALLTGVRAAPVSLVASDEAQCPTCLELAEELEQLRQRLAASGQFVTYSPGPNPNPGVERELSRCWA